jgi:hypothetical protein
VDSILLKELPPVDDADAVIIIFLFSFPICFISINLMKMIIDLEVCNLRDWLLKDWWI